MSTKSVLVFCGARPGTSPAMTEAASDLGTALAKSGMRLVFGAGDAGIMGAVSAGAKAAGGRALGVIPQHLIGRELTGSARDQLIVTETMHERKKVMVLNSDAIVLLPGGAGSLDEFFEVLTWAQLGLHDKPIFVVNIEGYWTPLLALVDHLIDHEFAEPAVRDLFAVVPDISTLMDALTP